MLAPYSTSQMDDFYASLGCGIVKSSGVMNYLQHLFIVQRAASPVGHSVLDVCCGRGLLVPLLARYAPAISGYLGIDISKQNLDEASAVLKRLDGQLPFACRFVQADATNLSSTLRAKFTIISYTSAIEHMPKAEALLSLREIVSLLASHGRLYLSTPRTIRTPTSRLQYRVHIYEWDLPEMEEALDSCGLEVLEVVGLLPPSDDVLEAAILAQFGEGAVRWYRAMSLTVPVPFLAPVVASALPEVAKELMFVCKRKE
jgi:SAM-dependent methyltransferase